MSRNKSTATITTTTQIIVLKGSGIGMTLRIALIPQSNTPMMIKAIRIPSRLMVLDYLLLVGLHLFPVTNECSPTTLSVNR